MSARLRRLLSVLAITVGVTALTFAYVYGPEKTAPAMTFTLCYYTNYMGRIAVVGVTNQETCGLVFIQWDTELQGTADYRYHEAPAGPAKLARGEGCITLVYVPVSNWTPPHPPRWRVSCRVIRDTLPNRIRARAAKLPWLGRWIKDPSEYVVTSEFFSQGSEWFNQR